MKYKYQVTYSANNSNTFRPKPSLHTNLADAEASARDWLDGHHYMSPGSESICRISDMRGVMLEIMAKHGRQERVYWTTALSLIGNRCSDLVLVAVYELSILSANDDYYGRYGNKRSHTDRATMFVRVCPHYEEEATQLVALDTHFKYLPGSGWWLEGCEWLGDKDVFHDFMLSCGKLDYGHVSNNYPYKVTKQLNSILNKLWRGRDSLVVQLPTKLYLELEKDA